MQNPLKSSMKPSDLQEVGGLLATRACRGLRLIDQRTVRAAVEPVNQHAEVQPDEEPHPRHDGEAHHQVHAEHRAQDRERRTHQHLERTVRVGALDPQDDHRRRQTTRKRTACRCWSSRPATLIGAKPATMATKHAGDDRRDVRRPEVRMDLADARREETVAAHREENARLAHQHDEQHARDAGHSAGGNETGGPVLVDDRERVATGAFRNCASFLYWTTGMMPHRMPPPQDTAPCR